MSTEFVWNEARAERMRSDCEAAMKRQADNMRETMEWYSRLAGALSTAASHEESIARDAVKTETTRVGGRVQTEAINAAAAQAATASRRAASMREQAAHLRAENTNLAAAIRDLENAIRQTNNYFSEMHGKATQVDSIGAELASQISGEIDAYINAMRELRDSFSDSFPMSPIPAGLLSRLTHTVRGITMSAQEAAELAGQRMECAVNGDPVNMSTGNFIYTKEDISVPGRHPLELKRFYNSIGGADDVSGQGWTHNYNMRVCTEDGLALVSFEDGHIEAYQELDDIRYVSPLSSRNILRRAGDGWELTTQQMDKYMFGGDGLLRGITDTDGKRIDFEHENGLLKKVTTSSGNLSFVYGKDRRLASVKDHTGRTVRYKYDGNLLVSATHPSGAKYEYSYDGRGLLSGITNPLGVTTLRNEYDSGGRMQKQEFPDGGSMGYSYDDNERRTVFTQQDGGRVSYRMDEKYRTTEIGYEDGIERFEYDNRNLRTLAIDKLGGRTSYEYDIAGNVTGITNALGIKAELGYSPFNQVSSVTVDGCVKLSNSFDGEGNLLAAEDATGNRTGFEYKDKGMPRKVMQPDGSEVHIEYDKRGNITEMTDAAGAVTEYRYDKLNRVIATVDGNGNETCFDYDSMGRIVRVTNAQGGRREYGYNKSGKVVCITDFDGGKITYKYNNLGKVEEVTDQAGGVTKLEYDLMWNVTGVTDPCGNTVRYEHDRLQRVVRTTDEEGNATGYEHDPLGNVTAVVLPTGARTEIKYDALGRRTEIKEPDGAVTKLSYDSFGNLTGVTDALGNVTKRCYDPADRLIKLTDPLGNETKLAYTPLGQISEITDAKGNTRRYGYYPGGRLKTLTMPGGETETYGYDKNGNIIKVTDALGNATELRYDSLGRVIETVNPLGYSKMFGYDAVGNITSMTDENGNVTQYRYSPLGDIIEVVDANGHSTKYDYDKMRRMTKFEQCRLIDDTLAGLQQQEYKVTTYERDKKGNVIAVTNPLGDIVRYGYDPLSNVTSKLDEDGNETLYEYSLANTLAKVIYADGKTVELSYDPMRQLTEMKDWLGTTKIEHDALGRAVKVTDHDGNEVGYSWDELGQRENLAYPDGSEVKYGYDASGRLDKVISDRGITSYTYDIMGRLMGRALPDGTATAYERDPLGRLESLTHGRGNDILDRFRYTYDPAGNMTRIDKQRTGMDADSGTFEYGYDPLNRLVSASKDGNIKHYRYDALGNRISEWLEHGTEIQNRKDHTYNTRNQPIRTLDGDVLTEYGFDKRGNMTQITEDGQLRQQFTFDATNMMTGAFTQGKGKAEYSYNGFKARVRKLETFQPGSTAVPDPEREYRYVIDMTKPYDNLMMMQGPENQSFVWGSGLIGASGEGTDGFYYLQDHLGSPIRLMGGDSSVEPLAYDEFGVPLVTTENIYQPFGFTGYQTEDITGLCYAQARYYRPELGKFIAEDKHWHPENCIYGDESQYNPFGEMVPSMEAIRQSGNLYGYALANPHVYLDKSGDIVITATAFLIGALIVGGIVGGGTQIVANVATGEDWHRNVVGSTLGGITYAGILVKTGFNIPAASYASATVRNLVNAGEDILFYDADPVPRLATAAACAVVEGSLAWGINTAVSSIPIISTNSGWFQPQSLRSFFTKSYGQKITQQTILSGVIEGALVTTSTSILGNLLKDNDTTSTTEEKDI